MRDDERATIDAMTTTTRPPQGSEPPLLNIANVLTVARIVMVPIFIWLFLHGSNTTMLVASLIFILAAWTDRLDGHLARTRGLITSFGKIADPIADKALTISALVLLSLSGWLWWWVTIIIIVRELGITVLRMVMLRKAVMAASRGGKLKTVLQMLALVGLLVPWGVFLPDMLAHILEIIAYVIMAAAFVVTVVTGLDYVRSALQIARSARDSSNSAGV